MTDDGGYKSQIYEEIVSRIHFLGCKHYRRKCRIVAPCCGEVFWCRRCHDEEKNEQEPDLKQRHEIDRFSIKEVVCANCDTRQPVSTKCKDCGVTFGEYSCMICNFFEDTDKQQFHCAECGICRVGGRENYIHCEKCACCRSVNDIDHVCLTENTMKECPICLDYLFDSTKPVSILKCGHAIHQHCLHDMMGNPNPTYGTQRFSCPLCSKSMQDMTRLWDELDRNVAENPMPEQYSNIQLNIYCNDCNTESTVPFHIWLKCVQCGSYNTRKN
ncbi:E3 ubiquitin--protein ligase MIEL1-like protein [Tetraselmis virus 1]|uniref:E3 ubiquitin--protein ligase MIEL1-like protein n=1 Tax=Tetraselmis virus 1 TaxID=2060617 RepID=A0A2P0VMW7_9VIRU|nr:E3 ubiquitin--protein ligase MIEL1-like protein [Tetraselmis virus 1]AUF82230.1 E3 ubiquitin--protein ligase MIEL1-like protein [Tetraselmis virus 1]